MSRGTIVFFAGLVLLGVEARAQSPRVLYTWDGTGNVRSWVRNFGGTVTFENTTAGELTVIETSATAGASVAISDNFNEIIENPPRAGEGGIDLTGLSSIEVDVGHNGLGAVNVQFFVQASTGSTYKSLGPDVAVTPGVATYSLPLSGLAANEIVYVRTVGLNIRDHTGEGNLIWTLREVRTVGTPLAARDFATHEPGTSESGLNGAYVNFDGTSILGNTANGNQSGLSQNVDPVPAGNTGSLRWTDLAAGAGGAVAWVNGTIFNGNSFNERPTDMSNYEKLVVRMAATNIAGNVDSVLVQYYLQTGNFVYTAAGDNLLPADGSFHELCFPLDAIPDLNFVVAHGINLGAHAAGDLLIDVDSIRTSVGACPAPPPVPALAPWGAAALALLLLGAGGRLLRRRR